MRWPGRAALFLVIAAAGSAHGGGSVGRIGVLTVGDDADAVAAADAFFKAQVDADPAKTPDDAVNRHVQNAAEASEALAAMRVQDVAVIVALGDGAASAAAGIAARDRLVVFAAVDPAMAYELRRGGNACVAAGAEPDVIVADLRRAAPTLRRVGVFVPPGDEAAWKNGNDLGAAADVIVARSRGDTSEARAASALEQLLPGSDAVWLPPSVSAADAAALAAAMAKSGVPLVGSRASHLRAGCAVVIRSDPQVLGAMAAVLAKQLAAGADPGKVPVRRARRRLLEVNLPAAARLGFRAPLTLLAWADTIERPKLPVPR